MTDLQERLAEAAEEFHRRFQHVLNCDRCKEVTKDYVGKAKAGAAASCPYYKEETR